MPSAEKTTSSHFKTIQRFEPDYNPSVFTQYESERTGMQVVVVDQPGPKLYGYFALATEIHDDSGARKFTNSSSWPADVFSDHDDI